MNQSIYKFKFGILHCLLVLACLLMQLFDVASMYRFFAYLNWGSVLLLLPNTIDWRNRLEKKHLLTFVAVAVLLVLLNFVAISQMVWGKEVRRVMTAMFLGLAIWLLVKDNTKLINEYIRKVIISVIFVFAIVQSGAIWYFKKQFAVFDNPHFLAIYSTSLLISAVYYLIVLKGQWKWALLIPAMLLGYFILYSQSRPTWISLFICCFGLLFFLQAQYKKRVLLILVVLIGFLTIFNVQNFLGKISDLLLNLSTEERAYIWQDHWQMQMSSSAKDWLVGHGLSLSDYRADFELYEHPYRDIDRHYNMPHNFILEVLYASGLVGLALSLFVVGKLYKVLFRLIKLKNQDEPFYLLLFFVFTANLIIVSITQTFTSIYNMNMTAIIAGTILYKKTYDNK